MNVPLISIIMPEYNTKSDFLHAAIKSVINQTYNNIELIIICDGSSKKSRKILKLYENSDKRIRVIYKTKNHGVSEARNIGIIHSNGKYIMFIDSDDYYVNNNIIENCVKIIMNNQCDLYEFRITSTTNGKSDNNVSGVTNIEKYLSYAITTEVMNSVCNKIYKTKAIKNNFIKFNKNIAVGEDLLFNIDYLRKSNLIYIINSSYYYYRKPADNSYRKQYTPNKYENLMYVNDRMLYWLKDYSSNILIDYSKYIRLKNIYSCICDLNNATLKYDKSKIYIELKKYKKDNKNIIVKQCGYKIKFASYMYSYFNINLIYNLVNFHQKIKAAL